MQANKIIGSERQYSSWLLERLCVGDVFRLYIGQSTIGRSNTSTIRILDSDYVSRNHAQIIVTKEDTVHISDLNSINGISINEKLIHSASVELKAGDRIGVGVEIQSDADELDLSLPIFQLKHIPIRPVRKQHVAADSTAEEPKQPAVTSEASVKQPENAATLSNQKSDEKIMADEDVESKKNSEELTPTTSTTPTKENTINEFPKIISVEQIFGIGCVEKIPINSILPERVAADTTAAVPVTPDQGAVPETRHEPMIPNIKTEYLNSVKANIVHIFGDPDDIVMDNLLKVNPYVHKNLSTQPVATVDETLPGGRPRLFNGDCISLLSSDDDDDDCNKATNRAPPTVPKSSPNMLANCFNSSKESNDADGEAVAPAAVEPTLTATNSSNAVKSVEPQAASPIAADQEDYDSYVPRSDDEDVEELMFSQMILKDMKTDLGYKYNDDDDQQSDVTETGKAEPEETSHSTDQDVLPLIKEEPVDEPLPASISPKQTDIDDARVWIISDDEDFDQELENKVSGWSNKLFSQSIAQSQVYELAESMDSSFTDDAAGDEIYNAADDDESDENDFYQRELDGANKIIDEIFQTFKTEYEEPTVDSKAETGAPVIPASPPIELRRSKSKSPPLSSSGEDEPPPVAVEQEKDSPLIRRKCRRTWRICSSSDDEEATPSPSASVKKSVGQPQAPKRAAKPASAAKDEPPMEQHKSLNNWPGVEDQEPESAAAPIAEQPVAAKRGPPLVIDAPTLPKHKGKLRGVSAAPVSKAAAQARKLKVKANGVRESLRHEDMLKELQRKWLAKPATQRAEERERRQANSISRKLKLKKLAEEQQSGAKQAAQQAQKRPHDSDKGGDAIPKKPKVKVTAVNRGAFLTADEPAPSYKIPKRSVSSTNSRAPSLDDEQKDINDNPKPKPAGECAAANPTASPPLRQQASVRRPQRTTKITFASMEKSISGTLQNERKLDRLISAHSCLVNVEVRDENVSRKKKTVRFNDTPTVHLIDRVVGARRKVYSKDVMPRTVQSDRRTHVRQQHRLDDHTDELITMLLGWSNEWLRTRNAATTAARDCQLYPMMQPTFASQDHYKSVIFPLMKLEFIEGLERDYHGTENTKPVKVTLEFAALKNGRITLFTKMNYRQGEGLRYDLVIVNFVGAKANIGPTFAHVTNVNKGNNVNLTVILEILAKNLNIEYLLATVKELQLRPVVDNVRVEFGPFNAVMQLNATPLYDKILQPLQLLQCKAPPKQKIPYKGYDPMNEQQREVLINTYLKVIDETMPSITLIEGPPGTGKSRMITNLALQTLYGEEVRCLDRKILICAPSNCAVDIIAEKLLYIKNRMRPEVSFHVVRFGVLDKISPKVTSISLQKKAENDQLRRLKARNPNIEHLNKDCLREQMKLLEAEIAALQTRNIKDTVEQHQLLDKRKQLSLMQNIVTQTMRPEDKRGIYKWYLDMANIVCCTLSSCVKLSQYLDYFDVCIIDEATQCTEPWTLVPLKFGINALVLVGDTQQLPATVLSKKACDLGLSNSLFTRIQRCLEVANVANSKGVLSSLLTQYRMHPELCKWPNAYFYKNELKNGPNTYNYKSDIVPFSILSLAYSQNENCNNGKITNSLEAEFVAKLIKALDAYLPTTHNTYGVITPYAQHRNTLTAALKFAGLSHIMVNTIDSYQGVEKDVIIISNARTRGVGFLNNYQRLNVALTRPKRCLILCGSFANLEVVPAWRSLLSNARERKLYHEISAASVTADMHTNVIEKIKLKR